MACGLLFSRVLVFYGCCQGVFLIYSLDGVTGWGRIILRSEIWFLPVFSGLYGENRIIVLLRMRSARNNRTLYDWATVWGYSNSKSVISFLDSLHLTSLSL